MADEGKKKLFHVGSYRDPTVTLKYNYLPDQIKERTEVLQKLLNRFFPGSPTDALDHARGEWLPRASERLKKLEEEWEGEEAGYGIYLIIDLALLPFLVPPSLLEFIIAVIYGGRGQGSRLHSHFDMATIISTNGARNKDPQPVEFFIASISDAGGNVIGISRGGLTDEVSKHLKRCTLDFEYNDAIGEFELLTNIKEEMAPSKRVMTIKDRKIDAATALFHVFEPIYQAFLVYWNEEYMSNRVGTGMITIDAPPDIGQERTRYYSEKPARMQEIAKREDAATIKRAAAMDPAYKTANKEGRKQIEERCERRWRTPRKRRRNTKRMKRRKRREDTQPSHPKWCEM